MYSIDYYAYSSRMRNWNPGFKAAVSVMALVLCILADRISISLLITVTMGALTILAGGIVWKEYVALLRIPLAFLVMSTAAIAIGVSRHPYGRVLFSFLGYFLYLEEGGAGLALGLVLKAMGSVSAMYMLVLSTPANEVVGVLQRLHIPKLMIELMNMTYRFIFVIMDAQHYMKQAAQSRLGFWNFQTSCRSFGSIAGNLFVISLKKANSYYNALIARCYEGELLFLEEEEKVKGWQVFAASGYFLVLLLVWKIGI